MFIPMTTRRRWLTFSGLLPLILIAIGCEVSWGAPRGRGAGWIAEAAPQERDERTQDDAIRHLIAKYAQSIDEANTTLASEIWATTPDVSFIYPLGYERGWDEVKRNVYERAMAGLFSERKLRPYDIIVHVYGDAAWAEFRWHFVAKLRKDGSAVETNGRETQIYRKSGQRGWVLVHVHYSALPAAGETPGP